MINGAIIRKGLMGMVSTFCENEYDARAWVFNDSNASGDDSLASAQSTADLTFSCFIKCNDLSENPTILSIQQDENPTTGDTKLNVYVSNNKIVFDFDEYTDAVRITSTTSLVQNAWNWVGFSLDRVTSLSTTGKVRLIVNNTIDIDDDSYDISNFGGNAVDIAYGGRLTFMGINRDKLWLSNMWYGGTFIDLAVESNREKFIKCGRPVDLGATGTNPTGGSPYLLMFRSGNSPIGTGTIGFDTNNSTEDTGETVQI